MGQQQTLFENVESVENVACGILIRPHKIWTAD